MTVWSEVITLPDGHRIFYPDTDIVLSNDKPLVAIADESGTRPEETDDGVLWLDYDRPLSVEFHGSHQAIPVRDSDSDSKFVISDARTLLMLSAKFNWDIQVGEDRMRAIKL